MPIRQLFTPALLVLLLLSPFLGTAQADKPLNKKFQKTEFIFLRGQYQRALSSCDDLIKELKGNSGNSSYYLAKAHFTKARVLVRYRKLDLAGIESELKNGLEAIAKKEGKSSGAYSLGLAKCSEVYMEYGDYRTALAYLEDAEEIVEKNSVDESTTNDVKLIRMHWLMQTGFNKEALEVSNSLQTHMALNLVRNRPVKDLETGELKTEKLSKKDFIERKYNYLKYLNDQALILSSIGKLGEAQKKLDSNLEFVKNQMKKKHIAYVDVLDLQSRNHRAFDNISMSIKLMEKALDHNNGIKNKDRYQQTSTKRLEMMELHIRNKWRRGGLNNRQEAEKFRNLYHSTALRTFKEQSEIVANKRMLDALWQYLAVDNARERARRTIRAEKRINELLSDTKDLPREHPFRIKVLEAAVDIFQVNDSIFTVLAYEEELFKLYEKYYPDDSPVYHRARLDKASLDFKYRNQTEQALEIFNESFHDVYLDQINAIHLDFYHYGNIMTRIYASEDRYQSAESNAKMLVSRAKENFTSKEKENWRYGAQLTELINLYTQEGKFREAESHVADAHFALTSSKENERHQMEGALLSRARALLAQAQGDYYETKKHLRDWQTKANMPEDNPQDIIDFTPYYVKIGKIYACLEPLEKLRNKIQKDFGNEDSRLVQILNNLSYVYLEQGDLHLADSLITKATGISETVHSQNSFDYARTLTQSAKVHLEIGDYDKTIEEYQTTLRILKSLFPGDHLMIALRTSDLAMAKLYKGDNSPDIRDELNYAGSMVKSVLGTGGEQSIFFAGVIENLVFYYLAAGDPEKAEANLELARQIWKGTRTSRERLIKLGDLDYFEGRINQELGDYGKAMAQYNSATNNYLSSSTINDEHPKYLAVKSKLAEVQYMRGNEKQALSTVEKTTDAYLKFIQKNFKFMSEREKQKYWKSISQDFEFFNTIAFAVGKEKLIEDAYKFQLNTKAILLTSSVKVRKRILSSGDTSLIREYREYVQLKEEYHAALGKSLDELEEEKIDLDKLEDEIKILEKGLSARSNAFSNELKDKDLYEWKNVREQLRDKEYAIEILKYRHFTTTFSDSTVYVALILGKNFKTPKAVIIPNGRELDTKYLKYYRNATKFKIKDELSYGAFWEKIDAEIEDGARIFLSPDGAFNQINIEALPTPDGNYVLDKNEIVLVTNTKDLIQKRKEKSKTETTQQGKPLALLVGNPAFYSDPNSNRQTVKPLPGAEEEIKTVDKQLANANWDTKLFVYETATEDTIKQILNPRIFHIATHGYFVQDVKKQVNLAAEFDQNRGVQNPLLKSGLYLKNAGDIVDNNEYFNYNNSPGVLTAAEAMNLNLDKTELVVLSACETGRGAVETGEGVYGLQRAFLVAGAGSVVMSLFKVSDEVTNKLMETFYRKFLETNDKRQAFIDAKKEIRKEFKDPIFWGVFVMIGMD